MKIGAKLWSRLDVPGDTALAEPLIHAGRLPGAGLSFQGAALARYWASSSKAVQGQPRFGFQLPGE